MGDTERPLDGPWYDARVDFGPITDTRTLEGAVVQALDKLRNAPESVQSKRLTARALKYRDILASWEMFPPDPDEQTETVAQVLRVIGAIMSYLNAGDEDAVIDSSPASDSGPPASDSVPERPVTRTKRQKSVGRIELTQAGSDGEKIDILFPFRKRWVPVPGMRGVATKFLYEVGGNGGRHIVVRMTVDSRLDEHAQTGAELIYVLQGGISLGEDKLFAGAVIRVREGVTCPPITSLGESELLLIGTRRKKLCG